MPVVRNEAQIQLALQAMERDKELTVFAAAKRYGVPRKTLKRRRDGILPRSETIANSRNLDPLEEQVIIRRVLDLYEQGFSPGYGMVEDMANLLRASRNASRVGKRWALNFVQRQPELRTRWTRPYDY